MLHTAICYRTKSGRSCLAYYTYETVEEAEKTVEEMNRTHPKELFNGEVIDWEKITEFFVNEQEMMY